MPKHDDAARLGKARMKKICSLLLALALLSLTGCSPYLRPVAADYLGAANVSIPQQQPFHTDLSFDMLPDELPNAALEIARVRELKYRIEQGELKGAAAKEAAKQREEAYRGIQTAEALAYVRYCSDVTDETRRYAYDTLKVQAETLFALLTEVHLLLAQDPALSDAYDAETVEQLRLADSLYDPSLEPLRAQERALLGDYEAAVKGFTITAQGRTWTREQILSDPSLSYESFKTLYEAFLNAYNTEVGTIFLKLIDVRNRIAQSCGYPSYAEYAYARYDRDYTTSDTAALASRIRTDIVPLFVDRMDEVYLAQLRLSCGVFSEGPTLARVAETVGTLLPELQEPWTYMVSHGMLDCSASENRMQGSFTTYFTSYGAPFLFSTWDDSYGMVSTLLHEFGHYASYYRNGEAASASLDLCEIDSQGMELLAVAEYDRLYGALADAARTANLFAALYVLLSGCMEDAFQQYAYRTEGVTLAQLNAEYGRLCEAYGLSELGLDALSWTEIPHTFQSPLYYISYSVGMLTAWELFIMAETDRTAALDAYRAISTRQTGTKHRESLRGAGLTDPFDANACATLLDRIASVLKEDREGMGT